MKLIQSRENPQVRALLKLAASSRERRKTGTTVLEGENLLRAYHDAGGKAELVALSEAAYARPQLRQLLETVNAKTRLLLADGLVDKMSELVSGTGVLAVVKTPNPEPIPLELSSCVLLENVQDPGNLGSILRTAAAAGIPHVFLSPGSVFAWSPKVVRAGMGAHFLLSIHEDADFRGLLAHFDGRVVATAVRAERSLHEADLRGPVAWIFGNEGAGLSEEARRLATDTLCIPMPGQAESLNLAAAAAICLFEQVRQRAA
jgi:TrmH family RNA methyltransferase